MKIKDITDAVEAFAPLALQEGYDNSGLLVGRPDDELRGGVLLAVDVTDEVIAEAVELGCGMVVSHHPLIFHPLKRLNDASPAQRCVAAAIRHDIAVYACHTNLDAVRGGMSWRLGEMLGLADMQLLQCTDAGGGAGFGVVGILPQAVATGEYLDRVAGLLNIGAIRHSAIATEQVSRVALCTGSGASLMAEAAASGCQLYLTADLKYNDFFAPDGRFTVADIGHFESEFCAVGILFDILSKKITNFALHKSARSKNPVHYRMGAEAGKGGAESL